MIRTFTFIATAFLTIILGMALMFHPPIEVVVFILVVTGTVLMGWRFWAGNNPAEIDPPEPAA